MAYWSMNEPLEANKLNNWFSKALLWSGSQVTGTFNLTGNVYDYRKILVLFNNGGGILTGEVSNNATTIRVYCMEGIKDAQLTTKFRLFNIINAGATLTSTVNTSIGHSVDANHLASTTTTIIAIYGVR